MELFEKRVCLRCESGNLELTCGTTLSLILEILKREIVYLVSADDLNHYLSLINKVIELGNDTDNIVIEYDEKNYVLYNMIISGLDLKLQGIKEFMENN